MLYEFMFVSLYLGVQCARVLSLVLSCSRDSITVFIRYYNYVPRKCNAFYMLLLGDLERFRDLIL